MGGEREKLSEWARAGACQIRRLPSFPVLVELLARDAENVARLFVGEVEQVCNLGVRRKDRHRIVPLRHRLPRRESEQPQLCNRRGRIEREIQTTGSAHGGVTPARY